jgi:hypothetical protein
MDNFGSEGFEWSLDGVDPCRELEAGGTGTDDNTQLRSLSSFNMMRDLFLYRILNVTSCG